MTQSLAARLGIEHPELVAFVGGGGKSTLTLQLGHELVDRGHRVVMTTTTKMGTDQIPKWATVCRGLDEITAALERGEPAFALGSVDGPKVIGVTPGFVDEVFAAGDVTVLVEADGARRRSFKAPGPCEPVIPLTSTLVVVVAGVDAVGGSINDVCHRPTLVAGILGSSVDEAVQAEDIAAVAMHTDGGRKNVPRHARLIACLTKVDKAHREDAETIARTLPDDIPLVVIGTDTTS